MNKVIYILHERQTKEHFIALERLAKIKSFRIEYREYLVFRFFIKSIVKGDYTLFTKQLTNVAFLFGCLFTRNKVVVFGIAPLDFRLVLLRVFLSGHQVNYFTSWASWDGSFFPRRYKIGQNWIKRTWKVFLEKEIDGLVCVTESALQSVTRNFQIRCKTQVVYHSLNYDVELGYVKKFKPQFHIIIVGRLEKSKGIGEIFEIISGLDPSKFRFTFVGSGSLKQFVEIESEKLKNVDFVGFLEQTELFELYSKAHIQLLISRKYDGWEELFGMVIIEAMAKGVPTIATAHVGPSQVIEHGQNGYLVDETDELVEEVIEILNKISVDDLARMQKDILLTAKLYESSAISSKWKEVLSNE